MKFAGDLSLSTFKVAAELSFAGKLAMTPFMSPTRMQPLLPISAALQLCSNNRRSIRDVLNFPGIWVVGVVVRATCVGPRRNATCIRVVVQPGKFASIAKVGGVWIEYLSECPVGAGCFPAQPVDGMRVVHGAILDADNVSAEFEHKAGLLSDMSYRSSDDGAYERLKTAIASRPYGPEPDFAAC